MGLLTFFRLNRLINGIALNKVWVLDSVILKGIGQNLKYTIHSSLMPCFSSEIRSNERNFFYILVVWQLSVSLDMLVLKKKQDKLAASKSQPQAVIMKGKQTPP